MLAAAATNFKRMINKWKNNPKLLFFIHWLREFFFRLTVDRQLKMTF
jgi:hypothetical protein